MKAVIQRVSRASVSVAGELISSIGPGVVTLLGVCKGDTEEKLEKMIRKICELRIFEDTAGKMNLSLLDVKGSHLIVSQFTIAADCSSGRRPSFTSAESPDQAERLYREALETSRRLGVPTEGGVFRADMKVELVNDGPVTFVLET